MRRGDQKVNIIAKCEKRSTASALGRLSEREESWSKRKENEKGMSGKGEQKSRGRERRKMEEGGVKEGVPRGQQEKEGLSTS